MCSHGGTSSSVRSTASCAAPHAATGQTAVLRLTTCSARNVAARTAAVTGSPSSDNPAGALPTSASPAAAAARTSAELRSRARAARSENQVTTPATTSRRIRAQTPP